METGRNSQLRVKDRLTFEQGTLFQCMKNGKVRVLMDTGGIRDYLPKELIGVINVSGFSLSRRDSDRIRDGQT